MSTRAWNAVFILMVVVIGSMSSTMAGPPLSPAEVQIRDLLVERMLDGHDESVRVVVTPVLPDDRQRVEFRWMNGEVSVPVGTSRLAVVDDESPWVIGFHPVRIVFLDDKLTIIESRRVSFYPRVYVDGMRQSYRTLIAYRAVLPGPPPDRELAPLPGRAPKDSESGEFRYDHHYAVIIEGDVPRGPDAYPEFWTDPVQMYRMLLEYGFLDENIHVLYGEGHDEQDWHCKHYREKMVDFPATQQSIRDVFTWMKDGNAAKGIAKVTDQDFIFLFTFDHGNKSGTGHCASCLGTMSGCMHDTDFAQYFNAIPYKHRAVDMQQCFGGGFIDNLENNTTVISTAANCDETASQSGILGSCDGYRTYYGEWNYHWMSAMRGHKPWPGNEPVDADTNNNGEVSFLEAHNYAAAHDQAPEHPMWSDLGGLGDKLTLNAPIRGVFLKYKGHLISDTAHGNGDGVVDPGETVTIAVDLRNRGEDRATTVWASATSDHASSIAFLDNFVSWGDIAPAASVTSNAPHLVLRVAKNMPCGTIVRVTLHLTADGDYSTDQSFEFKVGSGSENTQTHSATDTPRSLLDKGSIESTINVNDPVAIHDINCKVRVDHPDANALELILTSPGSKNVTLHKDGRHPFQWNISATYDSQTNPDGPGSMSDYDGDDAQGVWRLMINDHTGDGRTGRLRGWSLFIAPVDVCHPASCSTPVPEAVGSSLRIAKISGTDIRLEWDAVSGASAYNVWRSRSARFTSPETSGHAESTSFEERGLPHQSSIYYYRVRSENTCRQESP